MLDLAILGILRIADARLRVAPARRWWARCVRDQLWLPLSDPSATRPVTGSPGDESTQTPASEVPPMTSKRGRVVYTITAEGKERFQELLAQIGPEAYDDPAFGVHFAFFSRTDQQTRIRILEGRRRRIEERREGLRDVLARAAERFDAYTLELQRHGLDACEREVRWLEELIATERSGRAPGADVGNTEMTVPPGDPGAVR
jgi:DNA-binding PadR family transcriptional regulator